MGSVWVHDRLWKRPLVFNAPYGVFEQRVLIHYDLWYASMLVKLLAALLPPEPENATTLLNELELHRVQLIRVLPHSLPIKTKVRSNDGDVIKARFPTREVPLLRMSTVEALLHQLSNETFTDTHGEEFARGFAASACARLHLHLVGITS